MVGVSIVARRNVFDPANVNASNRTAFYTHAAALHVMQFEHEDRQGALIEWISERWKLDEDVPLGLLNYVPVFIAGWLAAKETQ